MSPTLLEAAWSGSAMPYVRVRLSDRDAGVPRLRFARWYSGSEPDGPAGVALPADGSLVRARIDPGSSTLFVQRVTTPSSTSDFSAWSALATAMAAPGFGLHAAGSLVLLVYWDGVNVLVRDSTDAGATFGAHVPVTTVAGLEGIACAVRADGAGFIAWSAGGVVHAMTRPAGGAWSLPVAWTHSLASVSGLAAGDTEDWSLLVSGEDGSGATGCWSTRLGSGLSGPPGHWSPLAPIALASPGLDVGYRAAGVFAAGAPRASFVESYAGAGAFDRTMLGTGMAGAAFDDGEWREPVPFEHASPWGLAAANGASEVYLASPSGVWRAAPNGSPTEVTDAVVALRYEADRRGERLQLTLDAATLPIAPVVGAEVDCSPGYLTDVGLEAVPGRLLWATSIERRGGEVRVTAEGALGRLARWRAPRLLSWQPGAATVATIARSIARTAGVRLAAGGASLGATTLTPGFTVRAGESGAAALARLVGRLPDQLLGRGVDLLLVERDPAEAPTHAYGTTHPLRALELSDVAGGATWARVLGGGAVGEAVSASAGSLAEVGGGAIAVVVDPAATTAGLAAQRAASELRRAALGRELGTLEAAPNPGHEPGDVVEVTDATLGLDGARYRLTSVAFDYARQPRGRYAMRLGLGVV
ncbi:MAG: hypothetical protein AB7F65_05580 [Dehalococcoidia bacterium]